jgi:hypothetical protein
MYPVAWRNTPSTPLENSGRKREYASPVLVAYGDILSLTRNTGNNGNPDNGTHALQKTF